MKKILCFIIGHKIKAEQCPFTKATISYCIRCEPEKSMMHSSVKFK